MAIIKIGAPLSGVRGTIGGITFSANGSTAYARQWNRGPNPRTPPQQTQRQNIATMPALWAALSDTERADWRTFASDPAQELTNSLGETYYANGFNWFVKCNARLNRVDRSPITAVPTQARPSAPTISAFYVTLPGTPTNLATGGTPSDSSHTSGHPASLAFDGSLTTFFAAATGSLPTWIQYVMPTAAVLRRYSIYNKTADSTTPKDWTFERLDPGPTWTVLDTITGFAWDTTGYKDFYVSNDTASTTYRLNVSANNGSPTIMAIYEIEWDDGDVDGSVIIYPTDEFVNSPDYDLVCHVAQGATAARAFQYPGYLQLLATQSPGQTYASLQAPLTAQAGILAENRSWFARLYRQTQEGLRSAAATATATT